MVDVAKVLSSTTIAKPNNREWSVYLELLHCTPLGGVRYSLQMLWRIRKQKLNKSNTYITLIKIKDTDLG